MNLVLSNAQHPEYGVLTVPFPIPRDQYDGIIEMLEELEIGDAVARDCRVDQVSDEYPILKRLEGTAVNIDEMDYLAKRLDSFCDQEVAQFQAMAVVELGTFDMTDLINLTFCCQQATVITDFSDLGKIGTDHFLTLRGGCATTAALKEVDGREIALTLILNEEGRITPYGVVYDNGMKLEQLYDGRSFPDYDHGDTVLAVTMTNRNDPTGTETYVYLPVSKRKLDRILRRAEIYTPSEACLMFSHSCLPDALDRVIQGGNETLESLNDMARTLSELSVRDLDVLGAATLMTEPQNARQIEILAKHLGDFDLYPNIRNAKEYGKYMIQESGHFEYDPELEDYYQYEAYGTRRLQTEVGDFNAFGYIRYHGEVSIRELFSASAQRQGPQMKGL